MKNSGYSSKATTTVPVALPNVERIAESLTTTTAYLADPAFDNTRPMHVNQLAGSTSPYLNNTTIRWIGILGATCGKAQAEQSLVVVSIGYSACHWCHVMERETFEDEEAASFMNAHFFDQKVPRRAARCGSGLHGCRPTHDKAWWLPLNCVALPDGRPIWEEPTSKEQWIAGLKAVLEVWKEDPDQVLAYASKLSSAVNALDHPW